MEAQKSGPGPLEHPTPGPLEHPTFKASVPYH